MFEYYEARGPCCLLCVHGVYMPHDEAGDQKINCTLFGIIFEPDDCSEREVGPIGTVDIE